ncbi:hypothetical protein ACIQZG_20820 [Lysinibacillus sp. NPDC096418]|uniref:hypothetical protein n=1 Tax=Lysinibacillus sp. NPDC096418 TaxID=3364138 RepID=UPI0038226283
MEFKVRIVFNVGPAHDIYVSGASENDVIEKIGNMMKNGEVFCSNEGRKKWCFNMAQVIQFSVL